MLNIFPGIRKTSLGGNRLGARVVGSAIDTGVGNPVRNQPKQAGQGFALWHCFITNICMPESANDSCGAARPDVVLSKVGRRLYTERPAVTLALRQLGRG